MLFHLHSFDIIWRTFVDSAEIFKALYMERVAAGEDLYFLGVRVEGQLSLNLLPLYSLLVYIEETIKIFVAKLATPHSEQRATG